MTKSFKINNLDMFDLLLCAKRLVTNDEFKEPTMVFGSLHQGKKEVKTISFQA